MNHCNFVHSMEGVLEDAFQSDVQTFPGADPREVEAAQKQEAKRMKENAAAEKARAAAAKKEAATVKKIAAAPTAAHKEEAVATDMQRARKRELAAQKIRLYFKHFGGRLSVKEPKTLPKDDNGVYELLAAIETELQSAGGIQQADALFVNGARGLEQFTAVYNPLGLMLSGPAASLTATVAANKEQWHETITEFAIANAEWFMMGPGKRALVLIAQMVMTVDAANKAAIVRGSAAPVSEAQQQAVEDL